VFDQGTDASQTGLEGWKCVGRFLRNVDQHLDHIDKPLFLGCGLSSGLSGWKQQPVISQEFGSVDAAPGRWGTFSDDSRHGAGVA